MNYTDTPQWDNIEIKNIRDWFRQHIVYWGEEYILYSRRFHQELHALEIDTF